mmetsp:Transcript_31472/g.60795  ORF Transcript_31472/g.60795 Transcript_31472/m.60795 type:complete len:215 (+) Transcript_31472:430-1074(+)
MCLGAIAMARLYTKRKKNRVVSMSSSIIGMTEMAQNFVVGGLARMWVVIKCGRTILAALLLHHQLRNGTCHTTDQSILPSLSQPAGSRPNALVEKVSGQLTLHPRSAVVHSGSNRGLAALGQSQVLLLPLQLPLLHRLPQHAETLRLQLLGLQQQQQAGLLQMPRQERKRRTPLQKRTGVPAIKRRLMRRRVWQRSGARRRKMRIREEAKKITL